MRAFNPVYGALDSALFFHTCCLVYIMLGANQPRPSSWWAWPCASVYVVLVSP